VTQYAISTDGTRIAFDRYGSGPAVIFVPAAIQFRALSPQPGELAQSLADHGFTVVVFDRRGRGDTAATGPFTLAAELAGLRALIGEVGGNAALVGNSSGCAIALAAAAAGAPVTALALWELPLGEELGSQGAEFLAGLRQRVDAEALAWTQSAPHPQLFSSIRVPVLAMHGTDSLPLFATAAQLIAAAVPNGRVATVAGREHGWDVGEMTRVLADFLPR
jgi:pimeloyl-ACP methyl ester carboxylesterase